MNQTIFNSPEERKEKLANITAGLSEREIEASLDALAEQIADLFLAHITAVQEKKLKHREKVSKQDAEEQSQSIK